MTRKITVLLLPLALLSLRAGAQDPWTLDRCIDYAIENNISVQQTKLRSDNQAIQLNTAENSRLPGVNASLGTGMNFGRGIGEKNVYENKTTSNSSLGISAGASLFEGGRIRHTIAGRRLDLQAALKDLERAREDVSLNITSLYLKVLFNKELLKVAESQVELSKGQLERSEQLFKSGKNPESVVFESRALLAKDELSLTQSRNALTLSLLDLSQALNRESVDGFDIRVPELDEITLTAMGQMEKPDAVYGYAVENRPGIQAEKLRVQSSEKNLLVAKAARYPQISLGASVNDNFYYNIGPGQNKAFFKQLKDNLGEGVSLSVSIPIFNRLSTRNSIRSSQIAIQNQHLALLESQQALRKQIEQAYYTAEAAFQKYLSAVKSLEAAREAFRYEEEKAAAGRSTIFDFNDAKTRMEKSESDMVQAKFEFIFQRKILDFYAGEPLTFAKY